MRMKKSWDKRGLTFAKRGEEWRAGAERVAVIKTNVIAGRGYSEWVGKQAGGVA